MNEIICKFQNRYFTWDPKTFSHPLEMIRNLTALGRHLTIIIDPHIKVADGYFVHNDCTERGYYIKDKDGNDFEGKDSLLRTMQRLLHVYGAAKFFFSQNPRAE